LFAALNVGTGQIIGPHYKRWRRVEFRDFMNRIVKQHQGKEIPSVARQQAMPLDAADGVDLDSVTDVALSLTDEA
jgi:hypothetical protein